MGPQAMEGDLKVAPGTALLVGYDFTIPGNHPEATVSFLDASVAFQATCVSGPAQGTIVVALADASYTDPQNSSGWYPSGDQHSPSVYQGMTSIPDLCDGGLVRLQAGWHIHRHPRLHRSELQSERALALQRQRELRQLERDTRSVPIPQPEDGGDQ